jgi:hypothetical protein
MPFDDNRLPDLRTFTPGREGLRQLSYLLRHPELWPNPDFEWDFHEVYVDRFLEKKVRIGMFRHQIVRERCGTKGCALGLVVQMWPECCLAPIDDANTLSIDAAQRWFGMAHDDAKKIFSFNGYGDDENVTPIDVADAIDEYLSHN